MSDNQVSETRCETDTDMSEENSDCAFLNIPVEIFLYICSFLDARFIANSLSLVCKHFHDVLSDESVWKSRIAKHHESVYPALPVDNPDEFNWQEACAKIEDEHNRWKNKEKDMKRILLKDIHYASVDAVLLMKSGTLCFSGSRDHNLVAWDLQECKSSVDPNPKKVVENAHRGWIWKLEDFDGKLFSCSWDATVKSWDINCFEESCVFMCEQPALAIACSPSTMAVGLFNRRVMLFDPRASDKKIAFYKAHTGAVLALTMVNGYIVSASEDRTILVWDQRACKGSNAYPMCLSYADNSIYVGDVRGRVHLMNPNKGEFTVVESYDVGHTGKMTGIHHTAGSVMTCSSDGTMRILAPTRKLEPITVLKSQGGEITNFDYKSNVLAMGSTENFVEVWMPKSE
ncbi:F-box/WD repeat-containing protein 7 [Gryllus bimaculatus]|nr:F-box/WD repeat-containing protein 7 [Gryllus bimaculatus]